MFLCLELCPVGQQFNIHTTKIWVDLLKYFQRIVKSNAKISLTEFVWGKIPQFF